MTQLNIGIAGSGGRGGSFRAAVEATEMARVHAVCDSHQARLDESAEKLGASEKYLDFGEMLDKSELDAVIVGTPMQWHAPMAIMALDRGLHVLSEVTAAVSIDECRRLVAACERSKGVYMMAENACYMESNVVVKEMVRRGLFGDVYYAEGEYLHELKGLGERTTWRRKWQNGIDGITYGTHSLGPILQWMDDRVVRVCCEGSGVHHQDPRGEPYAQDTSVMLCKTAKGNLIKIRVDMISDYPGCNNNYQLQGTKGAYESHRIRNEPARIWLAELCEDSHAWLSLDDLGDDYLPDGYKADHEKANASGHGGSDFYVFLDFVRAILGEIPNPIDIHAAMDMTLPGLVSQQSIQHDGAWMDVPDSRIWSMADD